MKTATRTLGLFIALAFSLSAWAAEPEGGRTIRHSTDLGWTANQDVTEAFTKLLQDGTLKPGEELVLDHTYRINLATKSPRVLPTNFTLSAAKDAGFVVYGLSQETGAPVPVLELGDRNTLRNVTITFEGVPTKIIAPKRQAVFFKAVSLVASGKDDILIENCRLDGLISHNIRATDCRRLKVIGTQIVGGYWSVYLASVSDAIFWRCLFERSTCDGLKTGNSGSGRACSHILVENCVFQDNSGGDGIDTTGGLDNSIIRNTIFRRLGVSGMDIKSSYRGQKAALGDLEPENRNIRVENCTFLDMPNGIVLTTEASLLTPDNIRKYAVHDVDVIDCLFGHAETPLRSKKDGGYGVNFPSDQGEHMRAIFVKDAYNVRYRNMRLSGERILPFRVESVADGYWGARLGQEAKDALHALHKIEGGVINGNVLDEPVPPITPGATEVPFACGPR